MMQNTNENTPFQIRVTKVALVVTLLAVVGVVALVQSSWTPAAGHVSNKVQAELAKKTTDVAMDKSCPCPLIYYPVCGADGITYPNECVAKCQSAPVVCNKPCPCTKQVVGDDSDNQAVALKGKIKKDLKTGSSFFQVCFLFKQHHCQGQAVTIAGPLPEECKNIAIKRNYASYEEDGNPPCHETPTKDSLCPPNMIFSQCGAYPVCQRTCQYKNGRPCPLICYPGCVCKPGFIRISDKSRVCIPTTVC